MPMMSTAQISLSQWDLWQCHVRTHIGTIKIPPYWLPRIICSPASLWGYRLLPIGQSILTNLEKLSNTQLKTPLTPDKNPNPLYLFSTPTLFPNPPLIFEENLNSQRVALKPPGRSSEDGI
jgi:hypothetical protein